MKLLFFLLLLLLFLLLTYKSPAHSLIGTIAPDFSLPDETGTIHTLSKLRGSKVALYFYPKDDTPGCTAQACSLRDDFAELKKHGIILLGLSSDTAKSHIQFKKRHQLPFHLLSANKSICDAYNVSGYFFTKRHTFLINEKGIIIKIITHVNTKNHTQQILEGFGVS